MEEKISTKPDGRLSDCKLPSGNPLKSHSGEHDEVPIEEIDRKIRNIRAVLSEHKVNVADIQAVSGPSVTTYKVYPAPGVSCAKIKRLQDEIEFFLDAGGVRVVTLSDAVGIEVANEHPSVVPLKSLLEDAAFRESKAALPVAVGRDTEGKPCVVDLAKAPHILMAGETKQGKTTAVHSLILSLLYSRTPEDVKFVFIDPKDYELKVYRTLNEEYIAALPDVEKKTVLTTAEDAEKVLHSLCLELEYRYCALASDNVNNIKAYNAKAEEGKKMPYIVVVIDEYGDYLGLHGRDRKSMEIRSDIMSHIVDLAQKGRAAGIHLVITTNRISSKVTSGILKSNFPTRMAFRVTSEYDSYTILDHPGAERLTGNGDMILAQGAEMIRIQGAYADAGDIDAVIRAIGSRQDNGKRHDTPYCLPSVEDAGAEGFGSGGTTGLHNLDDWFEEAARLVVTTQIGSASHLQLKLGIGYVKAVNLTDQLEAAGIVGPQEGAKPRKVLVRTTDELEKKLKAYNDPEWVI